MTIRIWMKGEEIISHARLDDAVSYEKDATAITQRVLNNLALLKLAESGNIVGGVGVKLSSNDYVVCERPSDDGMGFAEMRTVVNACLGTQYNGHIPTV